MKGGLIKAIVLGVVLVTSGCHNLTVAPKPVTVSEVAFSGNQQNAGVIGCDQNGCLVTPGWVDHYRAMEKRFKIKILADKDIRSEGVNYRVTYEIANHFVILRTAERNNPPP